MVSHRPQQAAVAADITSPPLSQPATSHTIWSPRKQYAVLCAARMAALQGCQTAFESHCTKCMHSSNSICRHDVACTTACMQFLTLEGWMSLHFSTISFASSGTFVDSFNDLTVILSTPKGMQVHTTHWTLLRLPMHTACKPTEHVRACHAAHFLLVCSLLRIC